MLPAVFRAVHYFPVIHSENLLIPHLVLVPGSARRHPLASGELEVREACVSGQRRAFDHVSHLFQLERGLVCL